MRRLLPFVALLVVAGGCRRAPAPPGASASPPSRPTPGASATATATPVSRATGRLVAVVRPLELELHRVTGLSARHERELAGPDGARVLSVSVGAGADPAVCAVWAGPRANAVRCYDGGTETVATTGGKPLAVAVSPDGRRLAWAADDGDGYPDVYYGTRSGSTVPDAVRVPALTPTEEEADDASIQVAALAWAGDGALLVSWSYDSDVNGTVTRLDLAKPGRGWTYGAALGRERRRPIVTGALSPADGTSVLAVQAGVGEEFENGSRAVRLDLASGRVLEVVSTPLKGRNMHSVSGGAGGVLYQTVGFDGDLKTYWRAPGERRGSPVSGLPNDMLGAVAQV